MSNHESYTNAIAQCLVNRQGKERIFPFLWLHGEPKQRLQQELDAIYACGLRAICVESRPHPEFCQEGWWEDLEFILSYAKKRDMKVWALDDKHFPTGYANLAIQQKYPQLRKKAARIACVDVAGPRCAACQVLPAMDADEKLISVCAFRRTHREEVLDGSSGLLLEDIHDDLVFWDIPQGVWRVFFLIATHRGPAHFKNYIDMCDPESCQVMIKEIYEPHYQRFSRYFGNTFQGFFSDEPCFANNIGSFSDTLGIPNLILPWREDMVERLAQAAQLSADEAKLRLPALWFSMTEHTPAMRLAYMDTVTRLYRENFSAMLGNWCAQRGVCYIGHVIEDLGAHMRLGYGCGHYFRAMEGQHMAGMDIVLHQIMPGIHQHLHTYSTGSGRRAEPDFYHHTAVKLATSAAHLDEKKQGRTMCELYGAYGWAEGVPTMKYLTDFMLSGGINHFVPHAFSDRVEDPDCPPHFFNGGKNPQFPAFGQLMDYTARLCHVLSEGQTRVPVAIYYNAESEWSGDCHSIQNAAGVLGRCQTDYDFVPMDLLLEATGEQGLLQVRGCAYQVLLVPYGKVLPRALANQLRQLAAAGVQILYLEQRPAQDEQGKPLTLNGPVISTQALIQRSFTEGWRSVYTPDPQPELRVLHRQVGEKHLLFFHNISVERTLQTQLKLPVQGTVTAYDAWQNRVYSPAASDRLTLLPGEATVWCVAPGAEKLPANNTDWKKMQVSSVEVCLEQDGQLLHKETVTPEGLSNYARRFPRFGGQLIYRFTADLSQVSSLRLGQVGETAALWVNGQFCGTAVQPPYEIALDSCSRTGKDQVVISVAVNQGYRYRDRYSAQLPLPPMGLLGPILSQ